jgi:putative DNA primase/helicase
VANQVDFDLVSHARRIVQALGGTWTRRSDTVGAMCRCPAHDDRTPSLSVRIGQSALLFKCFGAGCSGRDIIAALDRLNLWQDTISNPPPINATKTSARRTAATDYSAAAKSLWRQSQPLEGTMAQTWLASRHLDTKAADLRFLPRCPLGTGKAARYYPAMLAAVRNELGLVAIQRTFLSFDGLAKAAFERPRRMLGNPHDGAVRLFAAGPVLGLAEGIETALAAAHLLGIPAWATLGAERLGAIALPACVNTLVLLPDTGATAVSQTEKALETYARLAISATCYPLSRALAQLSGTAQPCARQAPIQSKEPALSDKPSLSDWNDLVRRLREEGAGAQATAGMFADDLSGHLGAVDPKPKPERFS